MRTRGGRIGVVGVPEDPEPPDELMRQGQIAFDFGLFFQKGLGMGTGQANVKPYNRQLRDLIHAGKATPSWIVSHHLLLDEGHRCVRSLRRARRGLDQGRPAPRRPTSASGGSIPAALGRGLVAGIAGTAAMTAGQTVYDRITGTEGSTVPAEVGKRLIRGVLQREVSDERTGALNNAMHWLYGTGWGAVYGLGARQPGHGPGFALVVWAASLVQLPAMQLSPPVWEMPPSSIVPDLGFHLPYGTVVAQALRRLTR